MKILFNGHTGSNDRSGQAMFMQNPEKALIVAEAKEIVQSLTMIRKTQEASISSRFALAGKPKGPAWRGLSFVM